MTALQLQPSRRPICLHVFPSFGIGGVPLRMARIFNDLGSEFRHTIVALDNNTAAAASVEKQVDCTFLSISIPKSKLIKSVRMCAHELTRLRPDVLVTYNWGAIEWALANRLVTRFPHVHHEAGFGKEEAFKQLRRRILFRRWALQDANIVVPSRTLERLALTKWRLPKARLKHVPNGIDISRFSLGAMKSTASAERKPLVIGTIAPLRPEKNIARLLKAFSIARAKRDLRLIIAGDGSERQMLEKMADEMGERQSVSFVGHAAPDQILSQFDIFALSSDTEQMPNSLLEAMAMALPVAGLDVGDVREMVSPENTSFIAGSGDTEGLADAIIQLADLGTRRSQIGIANRDRVREKFDHSLMVSNWRNIFAAAAAKSNRAQTA